MIVLYGLKNCDTCRKTLKALKAQGRAARLHDLRADGLSPELLDGWIAAVGWEALLNRRGTTWRQLDAARRESLDAATARQLMLDHPALIKRPVSRIGDQVFVGAGADFQAAVAE